MPVSPSPTIVRRFLRWALLGCGIAVVTVALLGLIDRKLDPFDADPWWYLGVIGLVAIVLALGSPWRDRIPGD